MLRTSSAISAQLANVFWARISAGRRDSRKTAPSRKNSASTTAYAAPYNVPATCQTSVLTNRNVMNSNSNGSPRTIRLKNAGSCDHVRRPAQASNGSTP